MKKILKWFQDEGFGTKGFWMDLVLVFGSLGYFAYYSIFRFW